MNVPGGGDSIGKHRKLFVTENKIKKKMRSMKWPGESNCKDRKAS